ncbi:hypothetical protein THTE_2751 [Thermogutta terrifontis]|uniref:Uncharacterized protein n=1 Tax=Thermogutta terrifontis TaxID=1331910 RepID=A0A286RHB8_9BACT|nr:hypothetical protein THTE_2751 [Thermogutta terrifontis]
MARFWQNEERSACQTIMSMSDRRKVSQKAHGSSGVKRIQKAILCSSGNTSRCPIATRSDAPEGEQRAEEVICPAQPGWRPKPKTGSSTSRGRPATGPAEQWWESIPPVGRDDSSQSSKN